MFKEQINRFKNCNELISKFGKSLNGCEFDEIEQAVEVYFLMSIKLVERHSKAISILLQNELPIETFPLIRNLMETYFKLNWIIEPDNNSERRERVFKLEAHSFGEYDREMQLIKKHLDKDYSFFTKSEYFRISEFLETERENQKQLTKQGRDGKVIYKSAPPLAQIMGHVFRVKYYHFYRFICAYIHPSPFLKTFLLNLNKYKENPNHIVVPSVNQSLGIGLKFMSLTIGYCLEIFKSFNLENQKNRILYYNEIERNAFEGYKGYII